RKGGVGAAGGRRGIFRHPKQVRRALERGDRAIDESLQSRPGEIPRSPHEVAHLEQQVLKLAEQRLGVLAGPGGHHGLRWGRGRRGGGGRGGGRVGRGRVGGGG